MESSSETEYGYKKLMEHIFLHVRDFGLWVLRLFTLLITIGYFIPFFWNPPVLYYKALLCYIGISALRLQQRLSSISLTREFLNELLMEDAFHYLMYSVIFISIAPVTLVLLPIFFFCLLHSASYSLTLFDTLGQNSCCGARFLISLVEFQSRNILRLIALTEILLMPFTIILIYLGRAILLTPLFYYQFLYLRYLSRRNPYTRNVFHDLRLAVEKTANREGMPAFLSMLLLNCVRLVCRLGPSTPMQQPQQ